MKQEQLAALARMKKCAEDAFEHGFDEYMHELEFLPDDRFFEIVELYLKEVVGFRLRRGNTNGVGMAAWELFRKALCGEQGYDGIEMLRFAKTYGAVRQRLYTPLFDVVKSRGDDGYGDLLDNLPLLGQEAYVAMLGGKYSEDDILNEAMKVEERNFFSFVWRGENYHKESLWDAASKYCFFHLTKG